MMFLETPLFFSAVANRVLSGVDLMRALRQEAQEGEGPLREEVRHAFLVVDTLGTPAQDALMDAARRTGLTTIVDLFGVLVQASERGAAGAADTLLEGAARASEELRLAVEDSKGRALLRGTAMAVLFELPPLMVVSVGPALFMAIQGMAQTGR